MDKLGVLRALDLADAFAGVEPDPESRLWGWNGDAPILGRMVETYRPSLVIEVGAWLGQSTATLARALRAQGDGCVVTIDTWLGALEHWTDPELRQALKLRQGYPTLYSDFLSNMVKAGVADRIVPLPLPSQIAARLLAATPLRAGLIYIDGSHDEADVLADVTGYWQLLEPGGAIFGDDLPWPSVRRGVERFVATAGVTLVEEGLNWIIEKPVGWAPAAAVPPPARSWYRRFRDRARRVLGG